MSESFLFKPAKSVDELVAICREFYKRFPPDKIPVSITCNPKLLELHNQTCGKRAKLEGNPETVTAGELKIIKDNSMAKFVFYVGYDDGHEEMHTPVGVVSGPAEAGMTPERSQTVEGRLIEEFWWAGRLVTYVDGKVFRGSFEQACETIKEQGGQTNGQDGD